MTDMASAVTRLAVDRSESSSRTPRRERSLLDSKKRLEELSKARKSIRRPTTQDSGSNFRVNNISNNGLIYLRPVSQAPQPKSPAQSDSTPRTVLASSYGQSESLEIPRRPSADSHTDTTRDSPSQSNIKPLHSLTPPSKAPQSSRDVSLTSSNAHQGVSGSTTIADINNIQGSTIGSSTGRPSPRHAKSDGPVTARAATDRLVHAKVATADLPPLPNALSRTATAPNRPLENSRNSNPRIEFLNGLKRISSLDFSQRRSQRSNPRLPSSSGSTSQRAISTKASSHSHNESEVHQESAMILSKSLDRQPIQINIRFSPTNGQLLAASPSQLIVQITSPSMLDYELLSDFFLTFRLFLSTQELAARLIERLRWAVSSKEEPARIIRVRTFVALRHWILNYFVDDFVANFDLRCQFCNLVNGLCNELRHSDVETGGNLKILGELKKCWRRTCALYWDVPSHPFIESGEKDILPGGLIGSRDSEAVQKSSSIGGNYDINTLSMSDVAKQASFHGQESEQVQPLSKYAPQHAQNLSTHPMTRIRQQAQLHRDSSHQVNVSSQSPSGQSSTNVSKPLSGSGSWKLSSPAQNRSRPSNIPPSSFQPQRYLHKRSGSFSDALRDDRAPLPTPKPKGVDERLIHAITIPGSLIRGALLQPMAPYVDTVAPSSPIDEDSTFDFSAVDERDESDSEKSESPANTPGVRRFLGSVRRALSTRQTTSPFANERRESLEIEESKQTTLMSSGRTPSRRGHSAPKRKLVAGKIQPRIDFLAAETAEAFTAACRAAEVTTKHTYASASDEHNISAKATSPGLTPASPLDHSTKMNRKHSNVTTGSRSIVILDDTGTHNSPDVDLGHFENGDSGSQFVQNSDRLSFSNADSAPGPSGTRVSDEPDIQSAGLKDGTSISQNQANDHDSNHYAEDGTSEIVRAHSMDPEQSNYAYLGANPQAFETKSFVGVSTISDATESDTTDPFHLERSPVKHLKRRPGGDLRRAEHVDDLNENIQRDSISSEHFQELHTTTESAAASSVNAVQTPEKPTGQAELTKKPLSGKKSDGPKPYFRPSIEMAAAKLAEIPDHPEESGIATALSRLEGRDQTEDAPIFSFDPTKIDTLRPPKSAVELSSNKLNGKDSGEGPEKNSFNDKSPPSPNVVVTQKSEPSLRQRKEVQANPRFTAGSQAISMTDSECSEHLIPLLQRGASHPPPQKGLRPTPDTTDLLRSTSRASPRPPARHGFSKTGSVDTLRGNLKLSPASKRSNTRESFFLDENESLSSLSSLSPDEISAVAGEDVRTGKLLDDRTSLNNDNEKQEAIERSFSQSGFDFFGHNKEVSNEETSDNTLLSSQTTEDSNQKVDSKVSRRDISSFDKSASEATRPLAPVAIHLPFVLGYDSLLLAQQFTLIEKDALSEIEWRDLIDLRWKQSSPYVRNWVDFLKTNTINKSGQIIRGGIDLCIARFNLMSRWALSEIVLTQDPAERAACIVKFIHVAHHARRLRNWATMYQITMALVRSDCSRLKQTWALVPDAELEVLKVLEKLIMPTRNFSSLRTEMESVTSEGAHGSESGCIPFIGIYTHDLVYNSQKPPYVPSQPNEEEPKLVNFERHHAAATIVKNLLRLIEASSRYTFQPVPEVASRCLWTAALSDEEITARSSELES